MEWLKDHLELWHSELHQEYIDLLKTSSIPENLSQKLEFVSGNTLYRITPPEYGLIDELIQQTSTSDPLYYQYVGYRNIMLSKKVNRNDRNKSSEELADNIARFKAGDLSCKAKVVDKVIGLKNETYRDMTNTFDSLTMPIMYIKALPDISEDVVEVKSKKKKGKKIVSDEAEASNNPDPDYDEGEVKNKKTGAKKVSKKKSETNDSEEIVKVKKTKTPPRKVAVDPEKSKNAAKKVILENLRRNADFPFKTKEECQSNKRSSPYYITKNDLIDTIKRNPELADAMPKNLNSLTKEKICDELFSS